jgi:hypothetical protein
MMTTMKKMKTTFLSWILTTFVALTWIDANVTVSDGCYYECKLNKGKRMRNIFEEIVDGFKHLAKQRDDMDGAGISEGWNGY